MADDDRAGAGFYLLHDDKIDDPWEDLAWLRENRPVLFHEELGQWYVFRYDDVRELFADPRMSADRMAGFVDAAPENVRDDVREVAPLLESFMLFMDGEPHARIRKALHEGFNASAIAGMRDAIERSTAELLDAAARDGRMDLAGDVAFLLPAHALSDFLAVPPEDRPRIVQWSVDFIDFFNIQPINEDTSRRMVQSSRAFRDYALGLLAKRRAEPADDFLGTLVAAQDRGELDEQEIVANVMLLAIAGHVAVRNLIGNAVWLLLTDAEAREAYLADPEGLADALIDETLRYEPAITLIPRIALEEIEVAGERIPPGAIVQLSIASANRDPAQFPDPDRFDLQRRPHGIMSFGHGPHGCLGIRLARLQAEIALPAFFRRFPNLRLDDAREIVWYRNAANRGPETLPVTWTP